MIHKLNNSAETTMSGEHKLRSRRNRFLRYIVIAFILSLLGGWMTGWLGDQVELGAFPAWAFIVTLVVVGIAFAWFTRDFFRRVDQLDLVDQFWSHLIGYYTGLCLFGAWYIFYDVGLIAEPKAIPIVAAMLAVTFLTYGARKLGWL